MDFSDPMHSELKGGSKRVAWAKIQAENEWYINKHFLLPN